MRLRKENSGVRVHTPGGDDASFRIKPKLGTETEPDIEDDEWKLARSRFRLFVRVCALCTFFSQQHYIISLGTLALSKDASNRTLIPYRKSHRRNFFPRVVEALKLFVRLIKL